MADYYPLLTRALDALSERSPEMRRAVYERARGALMEQLRSLDPPLSEGDIARERLALDQAIDRVEAEQKRVGSFVEEVTGSSEAAAGDYGRGTAAREAARPTSPEPMLPRRPEDERPVPFRLPSASARSLNEEVLARQEPSRPEPQTRERPRVETVSRRIERRGRGRNIVLAVALAAVIGAIAVAAWLLRDKPADLPRQPVVAEAPAQPERDNKLGERVAGERAPATAPAPGVPSAAPRGEVAVAQRAVLYEENQADPQNPKATQARAVWRLENMNTGQGQPLETAVRAQIDIPEAKMSLAMLIRRNLDPTLPASHTIELTFTTPPGEPGRTVRDVGLLQFKNDENVRGTPVAGLPVPVRENLFLIGLSNLSGDIERNTDLMLKRNWIDLPIRFTSGQRAIISFEKGLAGEQMMNEAFRQWQQR